MKSVFTAVLFTSILSIGTLVKAANPWADLFPEQLMTASGEFVNRDTVLARKIVGIYFGAKWCGPCQSFTPPLVEFRNKNQAEFEVVFASADNSKSEQLSYMQGKKMTFPAVECKTNAANKLYSKYGVRGIPSLIIVSPSDGSTISTNGRGELSNNPNGCLAEWKKKVVVTPPEKPVISSFGGKTVIFEGESVTLEWDQQGASSLRLTPGGSVETNQRSIIVTPSHSTSYLLTASSEGGSASARHEILVFPRPPEDSWTKLEEEPSSTEDALPFGSPWSYHVPNDGQCPKQKDHDFYTTWMKSEGYDGEGFNRSGRGILGYGTIDKGQLGTNIGAPASGKRYTAYFKRSFTMDAEVKAGFEILCDDAAVVYLDGVEIARTSNFTQPDAFNLLASKTGSETETQLFGTGTLSKGMHTLAVSVHNASVTSSDLGFDLRLFTIVDPTGGNGEFTNWAKENGLSDRPAEDQAMDADPDGDGKPNLLEYALGGNPLSDQEESLQETIADESKASITFFRVKQSVDSALTYKVQLCPNLNVGWEDGRVKVEGAADGVAQTGLPDGKVGLLSKFERVRATFLQDPSTPLNQAFLRIVISRD